jgi:hypothetical protein
MSNRVVVCAAIKYGDVIVCGARHYDSIMREQIKFMNIANYRITPSFIVQGFIDQYGVFMDRKEALCVAHEAGQINTRRPKTDPFDELFSEDLY